MALYQDNNREIRYLNNTEREQNIIGNYYRDIIRQYGLDVNYYKGKLPYMEEFKPILDKNALIRHAYGYDDQIDYSVSCKMISYMEVQDDLLQLDKFGIIPNTTVNFWFDRLDFAYALAEKLGQLKEYKVKETEFTMEVPSVSDVIYYKVDENGNVTETYHELPEDTTDIYTYQLSNDIFPYALGYNVPETFETEILTGHFGVVIPPYELDKEYTVVCEVLDHGDVNIEVPTNIWTANSFKRKIKNEDFVETMLFLTYKVRKVETEPGVERYFLHGKLHGGVLFNDIHKIGKYMDLIHPDVGDIVTIGFPDQQSRQQYEITDCTDKRITNDGINPLLGKYVWVCKAKRYVPSGENFPEENLDNNRVREGIEMLNDADEAIAEKIGKYDEENNDAVYGGYKRKPSNYDSRKVDYSKNPKLEFIDDGHWIELFTFHDSCMLVTDGYELYFVDSKNQCFKITTVEDNRVISENLVASGIQYIKASDNALFFVNFDNRACKICEDPSITHGEIELCLNSLVTTTFDGPTHNENGQCFYKFRESRTVLISMNDCLYCRFGNKNGQLVRLAGEFAPPCDHDYGDSDPIES